MTRAEKWLIVGAAGDVGEGDASWYNIVADGMAQRGEYDAKLGDLPIKRVSVLDWDAPNLVAFAPAEARAVTVPEFTPLDVPQRPKTLSPSELGGPKAMQGDPSELDLDDALARGTLIHKLLEHLPMAPPDQRLDLGLRLVPADDPALVQDIITLIDKPDLDWLWDADALTEVDITADLAGIGRIHGAIDRLIITDRKITAIDYKSNQIVPDTPAQTPLGLQRQLAAYAQALRSIYPDHTIEAAILWTHTGTLMVLPDDLLHDALSGLTTP
jgi:ATP-dependent helicase/nuclease subunit A